MPEHVVLSEDSGSAEARRAMQLSLGVGIAMLGGKWAAYLLTGSAAIFSDAMESVVHIAAVGFAAFSLWLSHRPANQRFLYGYERISFFSAGFEGAMISLAGVVIILSAARKWMEGLTIERIGAGALLVAAAGLVNGALGLYLVRTGQRRRSLILEANGKHILADCWTSLGVVGGLCLVLLTGWKPFDPIFAIAVALQILWSGARLIQRSLGGLMDYADPRKEAALREQLDGLTQELGLRYHALRFRDTGTRLLVEVHLLFPSRMTIGEAHMLATRLERELPARLTFGVEVISHLESLEDHSQIHPEESPI